MRIKIWVLPRIDESMQMQIQTPFVGCRRKVSLALLRKMLSSTSFSNPNINLSCRSNCTMNTPSSDLSSKTPKLPPSSPNSPNFRLSLSKCFSAAPTTNPIPVFDQLVSTNTEKVKLEDSTLESSLVVVSFYKFADFPDHAQLRKPLKDLCEKLNELGVFDSDSSNFVCISRADNAQRVSGGIILAPEGINGSICGIRESVEEVLGFIQSDGRLKGLRQIESPVSPEEEAIHHGHSSSSPLAAGEDSPFRWDHVRVKIKKEIVSLGVPSVSPCEKVGKYVSPKDWNGLISDPDIVVIDVRNDYETRIGKFKGAVDPRTSAFREFPDWVDDKLKSTPPRVAMYCTGGIRCEKASSFLLSKGFKEVYHLEGGILKYLDEVPKNESLWEGECFVFDKRVSVDHGLVQGNFKLCYGCKQPVSDADMAAPEFEYAVSCPYCYESKSEEEKERARARQRQFETWGVIGGPDKGRRPSKQPEVKGGNQRSTALN